VEFTRSAVHKFAFSGTGDAINAVEKGAQLKRTINLAEINVAPERAGNSWGGSHQAHDAVAPEVPLGGENQLLDRVEVDLFEVVLPKFPRVQFKSIGIRVVIIIKPGGGRDRGAQEEDRKQEKEQARHIFAARVQQGKKFQKVP
jgi:hypothetical protein